MPTLPWIQGTLFVERKKERKKQAGHFITEHNLELNIFHLLRLLIVIPLRSLWVYDAFIFNV